jgi:hypothetical protein
VGLLNSACWLSGVSFQDCGLVFSGHCASLIAIEAFRNSLRKQTICTGPGHAEDHHESGNHDEQRFRQQPGKICLWGRRHRPHLPVSLNCASPFTLLLSSSGSWRTTVMSDSRMRYGSLRAPVGDRLRVSWSELRGMRAKPRVRDRWESGTKDDGVFCADCRWE